MKNALFALCLLTSTAAHAETGIASVYGNGDGYAGKCVAMQKPGGGALVIAALFLVAMSKASRAMTREYRVPNECAALAARASIPVVLTRREARRAVGKLEQYMLWPGVRECRTAAKRDWGM